MVTLKQYVKNLFDSFITDHMLQKYNFHISIAFLSLLAIIRCSNKKTSQINLKEKYKNEISNERNNNWRFNQNG